MQCVRCVNYLEVALVGMNMLPARVGNFPTYCPILTARVVNMFPAHAYRICRKYFWQIYESVGSFFSGIF